MTLKKVGLALLLLLIISSVVNSGAKAGSIFDSKHNLSSSGPGEIKSQSETRVCIFCHNSHNSSSDGPLWNHKSTTVASFKTYNRSTLTSRPEQPNGATKLCLSCHDGTIAVGAIRGLSEPIAMAGVNNNGTIPTSRKSNIGSDLTGTHPVSLKFSQSAALTSKHLKWPLNDPANKGFLDANGYIQCTSCHDPHSSQSEKYPFWKRSTFSEVCQACHQY